MLAALALAGACNHVCFYFHDCSAAVDRPSDRKHIACMCSLSTCECVQPVYLLSKAGAMQFPTGGGALGLLLFVMLHP